MKHALVLAGGGSKGAYEAGFVKALDELGMTFQIVTGTSVGALNGCLIAQQDIPAMESLWDTMDISKVFGGNLTPDFGFNFESMINQSNLALSFFKKYIKEKGADITPLKNQMETLLNKKELLASPIDFGLCTVQYPSLKPLLITKEEMNKKYILDYLIASASCFPIFPIHTFDEKSYLDGGYYDNLPIDLAFEMGADEVLAVDMSQDATHPHYLNRPHVLYTRPYLDLGGFMDFSNETLKRNKRIGYQTAMKYFGNLVGVKYTFQAFETALFQEFYHYILYVERYSRSVMKNEKGSDLLDKFMEAYNHQPLQEKDYVYIGLDWLSELENRDPSYIYNYDLLVKDLLKSYQKYTNKDYKLKTMRSPQDISDMFKNISRKGIVGRILHAMLYPQEEKIKIDTFMTFFIKEVVMARFLYMLYHHKQ